MEFSDDNWKLAEVANRLQLKKKETVKTTMELSEDGAYQQEFVWVWRTGCRPLSDGHQAGYNL